MTRSLDVVVQDGGTERVEVDDAVIDDRTGGTSTRPGRHLRVTEAAGKAQGLCDPNRRRRSLCTAVL